MSEHVMMVIVAALAASLAYSVILAVQCLRLLVALTGGLQ